MEFLPCQGLEAWDLDLGKVVDCNDIFNGFELVRFNLLPPS